MKKTKAPAKPNPAMQIAAGLSRDRDELLRFAGVALDDFHTARIAGDAAGADQAFAGYSAAVYVLNGESYFACCADDDSACHVINRVHAAAPGEVPRWGRCGEFLVELDNMRARVRVTVTVGNPLQHFELHGIDYDRPFVTATGYLSIFPTVPPTPGQAVDDYARELLRKARRDTGRGKGIAIAGDAHGRSEALPDWAGPQLPGSPKPAEQLGFAF